MGAVAPFNLALAFALELAMLAAFAFFGFRSVDHPLLRWVLAVGLPLAAAAHLPCTARVNRPGLR
mgnify:FL=1